MGTTLHPLKDTFPIPKKTKKSLKRQMARWRRRQGSDPSRRDPSKPSAQRLVLVIAPTQRGKEKNMKTHKLILASLAVLIAVSSIAAAAPAPERNSPSVLPIRERAALVLKVVQKRLDTLLPRLMRETGIDMWVDLLQRGQPRSGLRDHDARSRTGARSPRSSCSTTAGPKKGVERINVTRTDTQGLFVNGWDAAAFDAKKGEGQWEAFGRIVRERNPKKIALNEGEVQWAAGALTTVLKKRIVEAIGPAFASRIVSAEPLATLWSETLLPEEIEIQEKAAAISHAIIAEMFSNRTITVGQTTAEDLRYFYWQRAADLGLKVSFSPFVSIRARSPETTWPRTARTTRRSGPATSSTATWASSTCAGTATTRSWPTS